MKVISWLAAAKLYYFLNQAVDAARTWAEVAPDDDHAEATAHLDALGQRLETLQMRPEFQPPNV